MKQLVLSLLLTVTMLAQGSRSVLITWGASVSTGVVGYNVFRASSSTGPFTTPLNSTPLTGLTYTDSTAVIGSTYTYAVEAVAIACTPTTPVGTPCGSSSPATATTTVPAQPGGTVTIVITIQ